MSALLRPAPGAFAMLLLFAIPAGAYVTPGPIFDAPGYVYASGNTSSVTLADVNLDGRADLVVGNDDDVAIALATAAGSFQRFQHFFPGLEYPYVRVGDFDGDGLPDLGILTDDELIVAYGDGLGAWPATFVMSATHEYGYPTVADLNGDGRSDLVGQNRDSTLSIYIAGPGRTMSEAGTITFPPDTPPSSVTIGDVVGSAAPDLVVALYDVQHFAIFPGNGDGSFGAEVDVAIPAAASQIALGALDAGAPIDVLVQHASSSLGITFASGAGGGAFGPFTALGQPSFGFDLLLRDLDHDGHLDALTYAQVGTRRVQAWLGDGAGGFGPRIDSIALAFPLYYLADGDFDGDGNLDLAAQMNPTFPSFIVTRGHGDGTFGDGPRAPLPVAGRLRGAAGDFDADGKLDAIGWNDNSKKLAFARGKGDGTFDPIVESAALPLAYTYGAVGQFDADDHLDLVTVALSPPTLSFLKGLGDGTFAAPVDFALGGLPKDPTIIDLDGNGKLDVVVPCTGANALHVFLQGAGGLSAAVPSATPAGPVAVRYADLNHDGRLDRVLACANQVVEQFDDGSGGYATVFSNPQTASPLDVALADLDEDGDLEAISNGDTGVSPPPSPILHVLTGQPGGVFAGETTVDVDFDPGGSTVYYPRTVTRLRFHDLDGDGHLDLAGRNPRGLSYVAARGNGDGTFQVAESYVGPWISLSVDLGDFDGDGHLDLLGTGAPGSVTSPLTSFMVLRNRAGGVVGVEPGPAGTPGALSLTRAWPSPGRSPLSIEFTAKVAADARADVYDATGRRVAGQSLGRIVAGPNRARLEGVVTLRAGIYWVRITAGDEHAARKFVVTGN